MEELTEAMQQCFNVITTYAGYEASGHIPTKEDYVKSLEQLLGAKRCLESAIVYFSRKLG